MASGKEMQRVEDDYKRQILAVRARLAKHIDSALGTMIELSESSESEAVRFQATKDLLDRGGVKAPPQTIHVDVEVQQAELQQVDREAAALLERLGRNHELPEHTPDLITLIVLEGDEDLVPADAVVNAIETTCIESP